MSQQLTALRVMSDEFFQNSFLDPNRNATPLLGFGTKISDDDQKIYLRKLLYTLILSKTTSLGEGWGGSLHLTLHSTPESI